MKDGDCGCNQTAEEFPAIQIDDIGYIKVQIGDVEQDIDAWEVNNRLVAIHEDHQGKPAHEQNAAVVEMMQSLGFPKVSHMAAHRFSIAITNRVGELLKKAGLSFAANAALPDTTASTPSD